MWHRNRRWRTQTCWALQPRHGHVSSRCLFFLFLPLFYFSSLIFLSLSTKTWSRQQQVSFFLFCPFFFFSLLFFPLPFNQDLVSSATGVFFSFFLFFFLFVSFPFFSSSPFNLVSRLPYIHIYVYIFFFLFSCFQFVFSLFFSTLPLISIVASRLSMSCFRFFFLFFSFFSRAQRRSIGNWLWKSGWRHAPRISSVLWFVDGASSCARVCGLERREFVG